MTWNHYLILLTYSKISTFFCHIGIQKDTFTLHATQFQETLLPDLNLARILKHDQTQVSKYNTVSYFDANAHLQLTLCYNKI